MNVEVYDKYITFTDTIIERYRSIPEADRNVYRGLLKDIRRRRESPCLNVALIGDFSSGKSTFINAFIQKDILKTAWLATTVIPTHIYYNEKNEMRIIVEDMGHKEYKINSPKEKRDLESKLGTVLPDNLKEILTVLSTNNDFIGRIKLIKVYVQSFETLRNICIIDTPGVNPGAHGTKAHVEITRNVLREYADTTIVLFRAQNVYTNSFKSFLEENASHFMNDAIFVITMMDLIDEEEREEVIEFVRMNLKENFHLSNPNVYACSAKYAEEKVKNRKEGDYWREEYDCLRKEIIQYMNRSRERIINQQIRNLLSQLMAQLADEVQTDMGRIKKQLQILEQNSIENMQAELQKSEEMYGSHIMKALYGEATAGVLTLEIEYENLLSEILMIANRQINSCTKIRGNGNDSIAGYMKHGLPALIKKEQDLFMKEMKKRLTSAYQELQNYYEANKLIFEKYSIKLKEGEYKLELNGEPEELQRSFGDVGYNDGEGMKLAFDVAEEVTIYAIGVPLALVDEVFGTSMSDTVIDAVDIFFGAASGIADGMVNIFGNLEEKRQNAVKVVENSIIKMRDEHKKELVDWFTGQVKLIADSMDEIGRQFMKEYEIVYGESKSRIDAERMELEKKIKDNQYMHGKLRKYLGQLKRTDIKGPSEEGNTCSPAYKAEDKTFKVLVMGDFNAGKTALVNALLGERLLPEGITPMTALITEIYYGRKKVILSTGLGDQNSGNEAFEIEPTFEEIKKYTVRPEGNSFEYKKMVIYWPIDFLKSGVVLIDSPGLFDLHTDAYHDIMESYVPNVDAVVYCMNAMCAFANIDKKTLEGICRKDVRPILVTTCFDVICMTQKKKQDFIDTTYQSFYSRYVDREYCHYVNSIQGLNSKLSGSKKDFVESGYYGLEEFLRRYRAGLDEIN